ncbi:hypothetical protein BJ138DRAFT_1112475 [Hygrophoropsis aurantiaca]|uniref:Uncharacterized protein n=1 Tax=Hygrophoropsis aurantiaca TaxID=72124 RepID=A0ACB8AH42_9AGAM|nr:hypothetical protein BJ138DRAFT_1112475 [Hygrophoropsis aurantiaca]
MMIPPPDSDTKHPDPPNETPEVLPPPLYDDSGYTNLDAKDEKEKCELSEDAESSISVSNSEGERVSDIEVDADPYVSAPQNITVDKSLPLPPLLPIPPPPPSAPANTNTRKGSWFSILASGSPRPPLKETRQTVLADIHTLVVPPASLSSSITSHQLPDPNTTLAALLVTCTEYKSNALTLCALLQEPSIAAHTPLYWAVIQRRARPALLPALLHYAGALEAETVRDLLSACLVASDREVLRSMRQGRPPFRSASALALTTHALFAGMQQTTDEVQVCNVGAEGAFVAHIDIPLWHRRMRAVGRVRVDFIASGRLWALSFLSSSLPPQSHSSKNKSKSKPNPPPQPQKTTRKSKGSGSSESWHVALELLEHSPPTYVNAQVIIEVPSVGEGGLTKTWDARDLDDRSKAGPNSALKGKSNIDALDATAAPLTAGSIVVSLSSGKYMLAWRSGKDKGKGKAKEGEGLEEGEGGGGVGKCWRSEIPPALVP